MKWSLILANSAKRALRRAPKKEQKNLLDALRELVDDPFSGDTKLLKGTNGAFRRRIGAWRIMFELHTDIRTIWVTDILRRSSHTY